MLLMISLFGLPILLGYLLFVALCGRFLPFPAPAQLAQRPQWFLALSLSTITALVVSLTAVAAFLLPVNQLDILWLPSLSLFIALLAINAGFYLWYRNTINQIIEATADKQDLSADAQLAIKLAKINEGESYADNSAYRAPWEPALYPDSTLTVEEMPLLRTRSLPTTQSEQAFIDLTVGDREDTLVETLLFDQTIAVNEIDADATIELRRKYLKTNAAFTEHNFSDTQLEF